MNKVYRLLGCVLMAGLLLATVSSLSPTAKAELSPHSAGASGSQENEIVLPDDRLVVGTVEEVKDGQVKVNTGQLMP